MQNSGENMSRECGIAPSFRGASKASEPGIHNHDREYGFRVSPCGRSRNDEAGRIADRDRRTHPPQIRWLPAPHTRMTAQRMTPSRINRLALTHFRNYRAAAIEASADLVALVGPNGSGKT